MTFSEPWFREFDGWWYCHRRQNGKRRRVRLAKGSDSRAAAYDRRHALSLPKDDPVSFVESKHAVASIDLYFDWCQKNLSQGTYDIYLHHLQSLSEHIGPEQFVSDLKLKHVTEWPEKHSWAGSTKAGAAQTVRTAFRWLRREGHIAINPVADSKTLTANPLLCEITDEIRLKFVEGCGAVASSAAASREAHHHPSSKMR